MNGYIHRIYLSPNRFGSLLNEDFSYDDNQQTRNSCNDQLCKQVDTNNVVNRRHNESNKSSPRPQVVVNLHPENQTVFRKRSVPGEKSYSEAVGNGSNRDRHNIKIFCDSIPKGMRMKELNKKINCGNAHLYSFPGATPHQLLHYLDVNLDKDTDTVLFHIGINHVLNSVSNVNSLLLNVRNMVKKCRNYGIKHIFVPGLVVTQRLSVGFLEDLQQKLASVCNDIQVHFIDNKNISGCYLFKDGLHLLDSVKGLLANNFINVFNNFLPIMHRPNLLT